jgi:small subunit ribosomal protein S4
MAKDFRNCRICRREGLKLYLKGERCYTPKCPIDKKGAVPPGQHGAKGRRRTSGYGDQLREKQKVKAIYGILEKQLQRYFQIAAKQKQATGTALLQILESRLDNVVNRLGLAPSRSVAKQLISHRHVLVDGQKVNVNSYLLQPNQIITLDATALKNKEVKASLAEKKSLPDWLQKKGPVGKVIRLPERDELDLDIDESLIVEYYSR